MTIVFGQLVNDFNDFGRGATSSERLQAAVNKNAYVHFPWITISA